MAEQDQGSSTPIIDQLPDQVSLGSDKRTAVTGVGDNETLPEATYKLQFDEVEVGGAGNCLFRSISDQLYKDGGSQHATVRRDICEYMDNNKDLFHSFFVAASTDDRPTIDDHIAKMKEEGAHGGHPEIVAASCLYNRVPKIFERLPNGEYKVLSQKGSNILDSVDPLYLLYIRQGQHYRSLHRKTSKDDISMAKEQIWTLAVEIDTKRQMHALAGTHLTSSYNWKLYMPTLVLTIAAAILSFLASFDGAISSSTKGYLSLAVGIINILLSSLVGVTKQLALGTRGTIHTQVATRLGKLLFEINIARRKPGVQYNELIDLHASIKREYKEATEDINTQVPNRISSAFGSLSAEIYDEIELDIEIPNADATANGFQVDSVHVNSKLNEALFQTFCDTMWFPLHLPESRWAVTKTIGDFKSKLERNANMEDNTLYTLMVNKTVARHKYQDGTVSGLRKQNNKATVDRKEDERYTTTSHSDGLPHDV